MKPIKALFLVAATAVFSLFLGGFFAQAIGAPSVAPAVSGGLFLLSLLPKGNYSLLDTTTPDLSKLSTDFLQWGGRILRRHVVALSLKSGVTMYRNVKVPQAMVKLSALGEPRPYREQDDMEGNGAAFTDRTLYVYQSKYDFTIDPERYRNKYLATDGKVPFYEFILDQIGIEFMSAINNKTIGKGVRKADGTGAADLASGWITLAAAEAAATKLVPKAIGAITGSNAVTQVEKFASAQPVWWREQGFVIKCSFATFDAYKTHYRASFGYTFQPRENGLFYLDGFANVYLEPVSWITNDGLMGVVFDALAFGTDGDQIAVHATPHLNLLKVRLMFPIGLEFEDLDCISVSDNLIAA